VSLTNINLLSKRLRYVASLIGKNDIIQDVGSDHAFLPIYLLSNNLVKKAYASEVNEGPYLTSLNNVKKYNLEDKIIVLKKDGLEDLASDVNTLTICGMGGALIADILEKGKKNLLNVKRLILAPNVGENKVRKWLMDNNYKIKNEEIIKEEKFYEIIEARKVVKKVSYSKEELMFGPLLLKTKSVNFIEKWMLEASKIQKLLKKL
jgi:tRNA (adenine22-N1)-methyltransferase